MRHVLPLPPHQSLWVAELSLFFYRCGRLDRAPGLGASCSRRQKHIVILSCKSMIRQGLELTEDHHADALSVGFSHFLKMWTIWNVSVVTWCCHHVVTSLPQCPGCRSQCCRWVARWEGLRTTGLDVHTHFWMDTQIPTWFTVIWLSIKQNILKKPRGRFHSSL